MDTPKSPAPAVDGTLTPHTSLLGTLHVPGGAARAAGFAALLACG